MGIMLIDASAEGRQDAHTLLNFPPQAALFLNTAVHSPIGLRWPPEGSEGPITEGSEFISDRCVFWDISHDLPALLTLNH